MAAELDTVLLGGCGADDDGRQLRRAQADEPQAHARLLVDRAHRLPARRRHGRRRKRTAAVLYYLTVYAAMNLGAFGVIMLLARPDNGAERIRGLRGLGAAQPDARPRDDGVHAVAHRHPAARRASSASSTCSPRRSSAAYVVLVVVAVLNSVLSAAYYLGVVRAMYFDAGGLEPVSGRPI